VLLDGDAFDVRRALRAPGLLRPFNDAGVLAAADVHVARRLVGLERGDGGDEVALAAALAVRGPRLGHVFVDLATIRDTATVDREEPVDLSGLPWPEPAAWTAALARSGLVAVGEEAAERRPLRLCGSRLYLDRYWREEGRLAADLLAFGSREPEAVDEELLAAGLARLFAGETAGRQCLAAAAAVLRRLAVVAGGPGTGKTTTVARIVALLAQQAAAAGAPEPLIALAAPTGKAAARLEEAVHDEARRLPLPEAERARLLGLEGSTLHRLLGRRPGSHSRFRHDRANRLPHDVVVVDETSMVSLSLMARLVEAVRPDARLVLVGDPGQLTSIEAGAVLGDVVGPAAEELRLTPAMRLRAGAVTGTLLAAPEPPAGAAVADGIVVLDRVHRFGGAIATLAEATRRGDADAVIATLAAGHPEVRWIDADAAATPDPAAIRSEAVASGRAVVDAARAGDGAAALEALGRFRLLCAHRRGEHGAATWMARVEGWLAAEVDHFGAGGRWYVGRPLLVTENDHELRLYNGDTGVVVRSGEDRVAAAFERRGAVVEVSPARLSAVDTVYAMTVHKSQGSQFATAAVVVPPPASQVLTRELLYTAITRARERLIVVGPEAAVRAAVGRPVARASGLRGRLWGGASS
jgi:exodeoxyribonuclease V alpha subunit